MNHRVQSTAFSASNKRISHIMEIIKRHSAAMTVESVLDLGCGSGTLIYNLAEILPKSRLTGVDITAPCIAAARQAAEISPHRSRLEFTNADLMEYSNGPFDFIICDSVVQNMATPTLELLAKLTTLLCPGGRIILTLPYGCLYNQLLWIVRRLLNLFRSRATDCFILALAKTLHRADMSEAMLRERIEYMYFAPYRFDGPAFRQALAAAGLRVLAQEPYPHSSPGQAKHRVLVLARDQA